MAVDNEIEALEEEKVAEIEDMLDLTYYTKILKGF